MKGYYFGIIDNFGTYNSEPMLIEKVEENSDRTLTLFNNGVPFTITNFYKTSIDGYIEYNIHSEYIDGFKIFYISRDKERVKAWINGYRASCEILKEFIHI